MFPPPLDQSSPSALADRVHGPSLKLGLGFSQRCRLTVCWSVWKSTARTTWTFIDSWSIRNVDSRDSTLRSADSWAPVSWIRSQAAEVGRHHPRRQLVDPSRTRAF